ncbi:hypothetical protein [Streptomyces venezuelae]
MAFSRDQSTPRVSATATSASRVRALMTIAKSAPGPRPCRTTASGAPYDSASVPISCQGSSPSSRYEAVRRRTISGSASTTLLRTRSVQP